MSTPIDIVLASNNAHKKVELAARLAHLPVRIVQLDDPPEPEETAETFRDNARIKAEAFAARYHLPALADDSGLCVDALDGAPGVYSARYAAREHSPLAERHPSDLANNLLLLQALEGSTQRHAHFHCALVLALDPDSLLGRRVMALDAARLPGGVELLAPDATWQFAALAAHGIARGTILPGRAEVDAHDRLVAGRGRGGFGYDPLFLSDDLGVTFAELPAAEKNRISHRARALDHLLAALEAVAWDAPR